PLRSSLPFKFPSYLGGRARLSTGRRAHAAAGTVQSSAECAADRKYRRRTLGRPRSHCFSLSNHARAGTVGDQSGPYRQASLSIRTSSTATTSTSDLYRFHRTLPPAAPREERGRDLLSAYRCPTQRSHYRGTGTRSSPGGDRASTGGHRRGNIPGAWWEE